MKLPSCRAWRVELYSILRWMDVYGYWLTLHRWEGGVSHVMGDGRMVSFFFCVGITPILEVFGIIEPQKRINQSEKRKPRGSHNEYYSMKYCKYRIL